MLKKTKEGTIISIRVIAGAAKDEICGVLKDAEGNSYLKIKVSTAPEKGKANKAVIKLLAKKLGFSSSYISLVTGKTSKKKTVLISESVPEIKLKLGIVFLL